MEKSPEASLPDLKEQLPTRVGEEMEQTSEG